MRFPAGQFVCFLLVSAIGAAGQTSPSTLPEAPSSVWDNSYRPITGKERFKWFVLGSAGPKSLGAGIFSAAIATAENTPVEYGPHWDGFGKRYAMRLTGVAASHAMEAGLGALWGEDPRYFHSEDRAFKGRVKHIIVMTFAARHEDGQLAPAYGRLIAIPGSNFLSNTWRADSVSNASAAAKRTGWGFLGRMGSNAFDEFWPDVKKHVFHKK